MKSSPLRDNVKFIFQMSFSLSKFIYWLHLFNTWKFCFGKHPSIFQWVNHLDKHISDKENGIDLIWNGLLYSNIYKKIK